MENDRSDCFPLRGRPDKLKLAIINTKADPHQCNGFYNASIH